MGGDEKCKDLQAVDQDTAEAEIINEENKTPLGILLEREESPLGEPDSTSDSIKTDEQPSVIPIGPLPKKYISDSEIPKISPPPGWSVPNQGLLVISFCQFLLISVVHSCTN